MKKTPVWPIAAAVTSVLFVLGWTGYCYFDALAGVISGNGAVGFRIPDVIYEVDGSKHHVRAYRSQGQHSIVFLVGAPSSSVEEERCNLLVDADSIARFNDGGRQFMITPLAVVAGETFNTPYPLDDNMKGWGTKYRIDRNEDTFSFEISAAPPHHPRGIRFYIPAKYLLPESKLFAFHF